MNYSSIRCFLWDIMQHPIKQKAFSLVWENDSSKQEGVINEFYTMRNWQNPAFEALKDAHYMILNAPTGSGKSWMMCLLSAFKMQNNPSLRTIISVPQTIIASGFLEAKIQMPTGEKIHWKIKHNFCEKSSQSTVNNLIKWVERNECNSLEDRAVICTHATLIHLHKKLKNLKKTELLNDVLVWIDEAHHVKNIESENMGVFNNSLGAVVSYIVNQENNNIQLGLTTASFFRGDRCSLLTQSMELKFERFNLPYDEYLKTMKHLKSFSIDFLLCGPQYHKAIELLIKERKAKDIIYIPHPVSGCSSGNKMQEVAQIIEGYGSPEQDITGPLVVAGKSQDSYKILNLVDENLRNEKKKFLKDPILKNDRNALDVIIALGMFKEGADWIWADRSIITGARSSLVDMIQMIGRLFRDAQGKEHVEVFQLLPFSLDQQNEDEFSQNLNDYLKAIFASLILENIFNPVKIKMLQGPKDKKQQSSGDDEHKADWLSQAVPNQVEQQALMEDVMNQLVEIKASNKEKFAEVSSLKEEYNKVVPDFIKTKYGVDEHSQEVADHVWNLFARRTAINSGISVENITLNLLQKIDPLDCIIRYTSNVCSIKTFEQFREAIQINRPQWKSFEDARSCVRSLNLKTMKQYNSYKLGEIPYLKDFPNIPKAPFEVYKKEWRGWGDWLGTGTIASQNRQYMPIEEAKIWVRSKNIKTNKEWRLLVKEANFPKDIPKNPAQTYKHNGWKTWADFFNTNNSRLIKWRPFEEVCRFMHSLKLKSEAEYLDYIYGKRTDLPPLPNDIPKSPWSIYKKEWDGMGHYLGTNVVAPRLRIYASYDDAEKFACELGLQRKEDWFLYVKGGMPHLAKLPNDMPATPDKTYRRLQYGSKWKGWRSFLGIKGLTNKEKSKSWRSYGLAKKIVQSLHLQTVSNWNLYIQKKMQNLSPLPFDIPKNPDQVYIEWESWPIFLGAERNRFDGSREFLLYEEAIKFVHPLGLKNQKEWHAYSHGEYKHLPSLPLNIPSIPSKVYKNKGWINLKNWLGKKDE